MTILAETAAPSPSFKQQPVMRAKRRAISYKTVAIHFIMLYNLPNIIVKMKVFIMAEEKKR